MKKWLSLIPILLIAIWLFPISNYYTRLLAVILIVMAFLTGIVIFWRLRVISFGLILLIFLLPIVLSLPDREFNRSDLASSFVKELTVYQDTPYFWGGEGRLGIDCSGLIRAALINATLKLGFFTVNPYLIRFGLSIWWYDSSARQLGQGDKNLTYLIGKAQSINNIDNTILNPGDLAVTSSGIHVLAYLGNKSWIEADPDLGKVVLLTTPQINNPWFNTPVRIVRFNIITQQPSSITPP